MKNQEVFRFGARALLALSFLGVSALFLGEVGSVARAETPAPAAPVAPVAQAKDAAAAAELATFLRDYQRALETQNRRYLAEHTVFPLPYSAVVYDMETKSQAKKLKDASALVKAQKEIAWPKALVPDGAAGLAKLRRGAEKCGDERAPDVPDFSAGAPAVEQSEKGDEAKLTYLAEPCSAETHLVILSFARTGKTWRLREVGAKLGAK